MSDRGQPIGQMLDSLGVEAELHDGDLISDVVVIAKVHPVEGQPTVLIAHSEALTWVDQLGLIHAGRVIVESGEVVRRDEE